MESFEKRKSNYRTSLDNYLWESRTTIAEYAETLGENYIMPILEPENEEALETATKALEMHKVLFSGDYEKYLDIDTNLAYALIKASVDGLKDRSQYKLLEEALTKIMLDPKLNARLEVESIQLMSSGRSSEELFNALVSLTGTNNLRDTLEKYERNLDLLKGKVFNKIIMNHPEYVFRIQVLSN